MLHHCISRALAIGIEVMTRRGIGEATGDAAGSGAINPVVIALTEADFTAPPAAQPIKPTKSKCKNFTEQDDVLLLRQVSADLPIKQGKGKLMYGWEATAEAVCSVEGFMKTELTGKSAQAHFNAHKKSDAKSKTLSGASEEYKERQQLMDELALLVAEHDRADTARTVAEKARAKKEESVGKGLRDEASERSRKRASMEPDDDASSASKKPRNPTVYELIREDNRKERQQQAEARREERKERRLECAEEREYREREREREREMKEQAAAREHQLILARLENEKFEKMIQLALLNAQASSKGGG